MRDVEGRTHAIDGCLAGKGCVLGDNLDGCDFARVLVLSELHAACNSIIGQCPISVDHRRAMATSEQ